MRGGDMGTVIYYYFITSYLLSYMFNLFLCLSIYLSIYLSRQKINSFLTVDFNMSESGDLEAHDGEPTQTIGDHDEEEAEGEVHLVAGA